MKTFIKYLLLLMTFAQIAFSGEVTVVSQIKKTEDGRAFLEVGGKPFFYNSVQAWKAPTKEFLMDSYEDNLNKAKEVGYKTFTFWLYWRDLEPQRESYDWTTLDSMIDRANELDMRLEIVWGGTSFCGHIDPRFAPDWLLEWTEVHKKDANGDPVLCKSGDFGMCPGADFSNPELFAKEKEFLELLLAHLETYDTQHRVIFFQVENEPDLPHSNIWSFNEVEVVLDYCNRIGAIFKTGNYRIATRLNLSGSAKFYPEIEDLEYIDCHGHDPYQDKVAKIKELVTRPTKMPHVAENAAYKNTTSLMITAFANGGGYNVYMLGPDLVWENPGIYDLNWEPWEVTYGVYNLNSGLNKASSLLATTHRSSMVAFNTETDYPEANYLKFKALGEKDIGFKTWGRGKKHNGAVGMALHKDGYYYLFADRITWFLSKTQPKEISSGCFNENDQWTETHRKYTIPEEDYYKIPYHAGECLRIRL